MDMSDKRSSRLQTIDESIRKGHYPNCGFLAKTCRVTVRCINRDIEFMRDRLKAPIAYDARQRGYYYANPCWSMLMSDVLTTREVDVLIKTRQLLQDYEGSPFFEEVQQTLRKVRHSRPGDGTESVLPEIYSFGELPERNFEPRLFAILDDAVRNRLKLVLSYATSFEEGVSERQFEPYRFHYSHQKRSWYVIGFCNLRKAIRIIGLHLVKDARLSDEHFTVPENFDARPYIEQVFDKPEDRQKYCVKFIFSPKRIDLYGLILHPSQESDICSDGSRIVRMLLEDIAPVAKWFANETHGVKILAAPPEFESLVHEQKWINNMEVRIHRNQMKKSHMVPAMKIYEGMLSRAQGCLMGQLTGDALGSMVEFLTPGEIADRYPHGVGMADGGMWDTIAGQPTDDSEMALMLARSIVSAGRYDQGLALRAYQEWRNSNPFDMGMTIRNALAGRHDAWSQANGAMMRISPLGIFCAGRNHDDTAAWAMQDAELTHVHPVCRQANALYAMAIAEAIRTGPTPGRLYASIAHWASGPEFDESLKEAVQMASERPPEDYQEAAGWVLVAFRNALYHLLHSDGPGKAIAATVAEGGDSDTNAAICGALLGAVHGLESLPSGWREAVLACRPMAGDPRVRRPRPKELWPVDALELANELLRAGFIREPGDRHDPGR
jgi:ADP-ribosylglycohydrolase/predicted DNA-binding transcriptional regulator YafY